MNRVTDAAATVHGDGTAFGSARRSSVPTMCPLLFFGRCRFSNSAPSALLLPEWVPFSPFCVSLPGIPMQARGPAGSENLGSRRCGGGLMEKSAARHVDYPTPPSWATRTGGYSTLRILEARLFDGARARYHVRMCLI
nr:hypothetical protein CFP56_60701 [Quercus suber]